MTLKECSFRGVVNLLGMVFVPVFFGFYSVRLGQDINWDLLNYHLYNPYSYIHDRIHVDLAPSGLQSYFNPFLDLVYFSLISVLSPKTVGFLIGFFQGLSFVFIYKISVNILGERRDVYAFFLGMVGLLSVGFVSEVGTTLNDSLVGVLSLASLWLATSALRNMAASDQNLSLILIGIAGMLIGIACGLKLVFAIYGLALLLGLIIVPIPWNIRFKLTFLFGVCAFAGLLLASGYWCYKIWDEFGNPLFPQFNNIFHGELASSEPMRDIRFLPRNFYEKLFYPAFFTVDPLRVSELPFRQINWIFGYVALFALAGACLFQSKKAERDRMLSPQLVLLISYFGIAYFLWLNIFGIYRYLIPIEVLIPLLLFIAIDHLFKPSIPRWWSLVFLSLITIFNLSSPPDWGRSNWSDKLYRVESSVLTASPEPAAIYLVGQPLAWIIPALEIKTPFIQLLPNMLVSDAYWKQANDAVEGRSGKKYAILESSSPDLASRASVGLAKLGFALDESVCHLLVGYLGSARHEYRFCEIKPLDG